MHRDESSQKPADPFVLIRLPEVLRIIPVGRSTWWQGVRDGRFPKPIKITPTVTAWRRSEVVDLVERLASGRSE